MMDTENTTPEAPALPPSPDKKDKDDLRAMGMDKKAAQKLLQSSRRGERYLNTKITARVLMIHHANSISQISMCQKEANRRLKDKDTDPRLRAACFAVVPQCGMALARLSEVTLATARNLDQPEDEGEKPKMLVQNNNYGFPPVSTGRENGRGKTDSNGNGEALEVPTEVKRG